MTCTGFPRPKPIKNIIKNPIGSICASGFGVSLHCNLGVGSPSLYDVHACAYSCNPIDTASIMLINMICVRSSENIYIDRKAKEKNAYRVTYYIGFSSCSGSSCRIVCVIGKSVVRTNSQNAFGHHILSVSICMVLARDTFS